MSHTAGILASLAGVTSLAEFADLIVKRRWESLDNLTDSSQTNQCDVKQFWLWEHDNFAADGFGAGILAGKIVCVFDVGICKLHSLLFEDVGGTDTLLLLWCCIRGCIW